MAKHLSPPLRQAIESATRNAAVRFHLVEYVAGVTAVRKFNPSFWGWQYYAVSSSDVARELPSTCRQTRTALAWAADAGLITSHQSRRGGPIRFSLPEHDVERIAHEAIGILRGRGIPFESETGSRGDG